MLTLNEIACYVLVPAAIGLLAYFTYFTGKFIVAFVIPHQRFRPKMSLEMFTVKVRRASFEERRSLYFENCRRHSAVVDRIIESDRVWELKALNDELEYLVEQAKILIEAMPRSRIHPRM